MSTSNTAKFLALIQPEDGWRCLFVLPARRHYWFQNVDTMAEAALEIDKGDVSVFHANATFKTKSRKADNVQSLKALWVDLDAGPGKPYDDPGAAYRAFEIWRAAAGLPAALVLASGGGLHCYWPLRDCLAIEQWLAGAARLRALATAHGLHIDPGSTIDAARVLRPPGTHNRKLLDPATGKKLSDVGGPPRLVRSGPAVGPYGLEELEPLFGKEVMPHSPSPPDNVAPPLELDALGAANAAALNVQAAGDDSDADPLAIAAECAQMRRLQDSKGDLPEPEWYALLGVLAHGGAGCAAAGHAWSAGDPRYSVDDTDRKLAQARRNSGPVTCGHLDSLNPIGCVGCKHQGRIATPLQLGRPMAPGLTAEAPAALQLPLLPAPYGYRGLQLVRKREPTENDKSQYHVICEFPLSVDQLQETEREGKISAVFRSWEPSQQSWREFSLNLGAVFGMGGRSQLADFGIVISKNRWDTFGEFIKILADLYRATKTYGTRYEQFGWKAGVVPGFVVGLALLQPGRLPEPIHGTDEVDRRGKLMAPMGDVARWAQAATALVAPAGMEGHRFMLLCGFAALLYKFTNEPGVTLVHATTAESGKGKTTMLNAIESIFGAQDALSLISRDTAVAKFTTIGVLSNLPVLFDELRFADPEEAKEYVLLTTQGRDKQRGKADGGIRADNYPWSTIHISAANPSLVDTVRYDGSETAQAARIFEFTLELPPGASTTAGDALRQQLRDNRGTAGRLFIQALLDRYDWAVSRVPERMRHYETLLGAGTDQRFIIRLFACVDVASAIVRGTGLLAFDHQAMMDWAVGIQTGNAERLASDSKIDPGSVIGRMVNDMWSRTLVMPGPAPRGGAANHLVVAEHEPQGELIARYERAGGIMLFDIVAVRRWMQKNNISYSQIGKQMKEAGIVTDLRARRTLGAGWKKTSGQTWCWEINGLHPDVSEALGDLVQVENVVPIRGMK